MSARDFRKWIRTQSARGIVIAFSQSGMRISRQAVYKWASGASNPRQYRTDVLLEISGNRLRIEDLGAPRRRNRRSR